MQIYVEASCLIIRSTRDTSNERLGLLKRPKGLSSKLEGFAGNHFVATIIMKSPFLESYL